MTTVANTATVDISSLQTGYNAGGDISTGKEITATVAAVSIISALQY